MAEANFWDNQESAQETVGELKSLKSLLNPLEEAIKNAADLDALQEMAEEDPSIADEVAAEIKGLEKILEDLELK